MTSQRIMLALASLMLAVSCAGAEAARDGGAPEPTADARFEIFGMD